MLPSLITMPKDLWLFMSVVNECKDLMKDLLRSIQSHEKQININQSRLYYWQDCFGQWK